MTNQGDVELGATEERQRIVWHPDVHRHFGTRLYFFLIHAGSLNFETAAEEIQSDLDKLRTKSFTVALVYGPETLLVRCWLTLRQHQALRDALRRRQWRFSDIEVERTQYLWAGDVEPLSPSHIALHLSDIRAVCATQTLYFDEDDPAVVRLRDASLLFVVPVRPADVIKLYSLISTPADRQLMQRAEDVLQRALEQAIGCGLLYEATLHVADEGFLVKAVVRSYPDILVTMTSLAKTGEPFAMSTSTMLVARLLDVEVDHLDLNDELPPVLTILAALLDGEMLDALVDAHPDARADVQKLYIEEGDLFEAAAADGSEVLGFLRGVVNYRLDANAPRLNEAAVPLWPKLEAVVREFVQKLLLDTCGRSWYSDLDLREILLRLGYHRKDPRNGKPVPTNIDQLSIADLAKVLGEVMRATPRLTNAFDARLPSEWRKTFGELYEIRNDMIHGHVLSKPHTTFLDGEWHEWARVFCEVAALFLAMRKALAS